MGKSKFIFQSFTKRTHLDAVRRIFEVDELERVILSVAFANAGGVELLADQIEPVADKVTAFVGIRNAITSQQGLARLLELGVDLYAVDTGSPNLLFHPKLYFTRGREEARLVIGSANLTAGGLNNNVEVGMATDLNLSDDDDNALAEEIEKEFDDSLSKFPDNIIAIETAEAIQELQDTDRLLDETAIRARSGADAEKGSAGGESGAGGVITLIKLLVTPIRSKSRRAGGSGGGVRAPAVPGGRLAAHATPTAPVAPAVATIVTPAAPTLELVWRSGALTERDLNIPRGSNTNVTGSMLFKQGRYAHIDQRHYFRDDVFGALSWTPDRSPRLRHLERARARFTINTDGVDQGDYTLRLTHNSDTTSRAYEQSNSMTQVHWEGVTQIIRDRALLGKSMKLYRDATDPKHFVIEID